MNYSIYQDNFDDLSLQVQKTMRNVIHGVNTKPIHTLDFLYSNSSSDDLPFYVKSRLSYNSPTAYAQLQKYIARIQEDLSFVLFVDPTLESDYFCGLLKSLSGLKLYIQSFILSTEQRLNTYFLDKLIASNDPILLIACREKLIYYKVMSYMKLPTESANIYIKKIEDAFCKQYGKASLQYFDQEKESMMGFDTAFGDDALSFARCVNSLKRYLHKQK